MRTITLILGFLVIIYTSSGVHAMELSGVPLSNEIRLSETARPLQLNGAGIRKKLFFTIYVAALYLPEKTADAQQIISQQSPKRVAMHMIYPQVDREKVIAGWNEGFEANHSREQLLALQSRLDQLNAMFGSLKEGDQVFFDYLPDQGTRVSINGTVKGIIPGADFNSALLRVWLGEEPVTKSLKAGLLGRS